MNVLLSPQPHVLPHYHENPRQSPQRGDSPLHAMSNRKRKADDDGDEAMSTSPSISHRPLARPSKKVRNNDALGRSLRLPRLLETLDADQLRTVLQHICEQHREIGQEVESQAPRPSVECAINVLQGYQDRLKAAAPYGDTSPEYTYHRVRENLLALLDALSDFTPQFLPPTEMQASLSLQFLDAATNFIHELPDLELQTYHHHKENAYEEISKAWALVINEASKKAGGFNLHSSGWDATLNRHNSRSDGRLATAVAAMGQNVGWIKQNSQAADQNSILNQLMSGSYGSPVRRNFHSRFSYSPIIHESIIPTLSKMPAPGQQHQSWQNPYEEPRPRMSVWTAQEIATIASKLDKQLGPEYISARAGPGGQRVHYLTAEKCITLANEVFGFNGWSSSIQNIQVDFADENPQTARVSIGLSVIVRITLRDGTYHEDIGYGSIENAKGKAMAFEKAKKEGTTDGLKRALRSFGNVLGNCIYDQDYVKQVIKHKAQPVKKFDPNNLHRHSDFKEDVKVEEPAKAPAAPAPEIPPLQARPKMEASESFEDFLGGMLSSDGFEEL
ncbi:Sts1 protein [Emericellopsis cladophorae]|uniref:Tethering factor for nuclear proteasome STS1 n=1 Tax=Emericellopsis cladophorae TaxID=2686198 RepID=A0A9Q0BEB1_9HYPO|nr:Sts1 protein [Emericellopsis cladophorae]KAI6781671.1 Sts1 protein [Emericellopsis cladophorae]